MVTPAPPGNFQLLSAGDSIVCAENGSINCWGDDRGDGLVPPPEKHALTLDVGPVHACGIDATKRVFCWGANLFGQSTVPN